MNLINSETVWFFISGSDEERFLDDINFGICCLNHRGIPLSNVYLFVDQPTNFNFLSAHNFPQNIKIYSTTQLEVQLSSINPSKLVLMITGHGCESGIAACPNISPFELLEIIKKNQNIEYTLIVLGQCYAGTFNYLQARSKDPNTGQVIKPEICIVGATNLTYSISIPIDISNQNTIKTFTCNHQWDANLFLFFFLRNIAEPVDIDGDERITVIDAYKAAGIYTDQVIRNMKQRAFEHLFTTTLSNTVSQLMQGTVAQTLAEKAKQELISTLNTILTNQNPWILHANLARQLEL